jgi:HEAT repeat protein
VRASAAEALGLIRDDSRETVEALTASLQSASDGGIRYKAAEALGRLGGRAKSALPALFKVLKTNDPLTRCVAAGAVLAIDPEKAPIVLPALREPGMSVDELLDLQTRAEAQAAAKAGVK